MTLATLLKTDLTSLPIRLSIVDSKDGLGIRNIGPGEAVKIPKSGDGLLSLIGKAVLKTLGWIFNLGAWALGGIATATVSLFVNVSNFIMNFNWNATDRELEGILNSYRGMFGSVLGGTLGNFLGWASCGGTLGVVIYSFNPLLGVKVLMDVGEEGLQELAANLTLTVQTMGNFVAAWALIESFKGWRRLAKYLANNPTDPTAKLFRKVVGSSGIAAIKKWGEKGSKPWTFAQKRDEWIESFPDGFAENFVEELVEEFWDACVEAFYVVAGNVDEYIAEQQIEKLAKFGPEEVVEIQPNRDVPEEKIVLAGPQELIKPVIVQTMTQHQLLDNRDVGMWVGEPVREAMKSPPMTIQLRIIMSSKENTVVGAKRVQITIPAVNRAKLDWADIKTRLGGVNGYMWGRYRGKAKLSGGHEIVVFAATDAEAVDRLTQLAWFSEEEVLGISVTEEKREGARKTIDALYKQPTRIYPYGMTIINQQKILNEESGITQLSGTYKRKKTSLIPLYVDTRPDDFSEVIAELFRVPGPNS
jgi:hypothetical protein